MQRQRQPEQKPTERTIQNDVFELGASDFDLDTSEMRYAVELYADLRRFER